MSDAADERARKVAVRLDVLAGEVAAALPAVVGAHHQLQRQRPAGRDRSAAGPVGAAAGTAAGSRCDSNASTSAPNRHRLDEARHLLHAAAHPHADQLQHRHQHDRRGGDERLVRREPRHQHAEVLGGGHAPRRPLPRSWRTSRRSRRRSRSCRRGRAARTRRTRRIAESSWPGRRAPPPPASAKSPPTTHISSASGRRSGVGHDRAGRAQDAGADRAADHDGEAEGDAENAQERHSPSDGLPARPARAAVSGRSDRRRL